MRAWCSYMLMIQAVSTIYTKVVWVCIGGCVCEGGVGVSVWKEGEVGMEMCLHL